MKLKYFFVPFLVLLFLSCPEEPDLSKGTFWVKDFIKNSDYKIKADLLYKGKYCTIWAEKGALTEAQAWDVANEYDNHIYPVMLETFGTEFIYKGQEENTMQYADVDGDGRLCILFLDIKDGYDGTAVNSYIAGYFYSLHMLPGMSSNKSDMIFIDTYPGISEGWDEIYKTMAHEMQHLMNYITTIGIMEGQAKNINNVDRKYMDTWIDEGLSSAAEYIYSGIHLQSRIDWYNKGKGEIIQGNNFFVWDDTKNRNNVLDDYSTVYLFFQWLRIQSGGTSIYNDIMKSGYGDYRAVTNAATKIDSSYSNWSTLLRDWLAANYINHFFNRFGYKKEIILTPHSPFGISSNSTVSLYPGEGVYSSLMGAAPSNNAGTNIKHATISSGSVSDSINNANGNILLTYNTNPNNLSGTEKGTTTGTPIPSASINADNQSRSLLGSSNGPYRIGAHGLNNYYPENTFLKFLMDDASDEN